MDKITQDTLKIFNLFIELQRKNRATGTLDGTQLTLVESQLIIELDLDKSSDIFSLAKKLSLNQSTVSRAVQSLSAAGLISIQKDKKDKRKLILALRPSAFSIMKKIDQAANKILQDFSENLTPNEVESLLSSLKKLLDLTEMDPASLRKNEHPFRAQQRRIARLIKKLSAEGIISNPELHLLKLLVDYENPLTPTQLAQTLCLKTSAVSILIKDLKKNKLITSEAKKSDARYENIIITQAGINKLVSSQVKQIKSIIPAVRKMTQPERDKIINLFGKFLTDPNQNPAKFNQQFKILRLKEDGRTNARVEYLKLSAKNNQLESVPEKIFDTDSICFGLYSNSNLMAAVQFDKQKNITCYYSKITPEYHLFDKYFKEISKSKF